MFNDFDLVGALYLGPVLICPSRLLRYRVEFCDDPRRETEALRSAMAFVEFRVSQKCQAERLRC